MPQILELTRTRHRASLAQNQILLSREVGKSNGEFKRANERQRRSLSYVPRVKDTPNAALALTPIGTRAKAGTCSASCASFPIRRGCAGRGHSGGSAAAGRCGKRGSGGGSRGASPLHSLPRFDRLTLARPWRSEQKSIIRCGFPAQLVIQRAQPFCATELVFGDLAMLHAVTIKSKATATPAMAARPLSIVRCHSEPTHT